MLAYSNSDKEKDVLFVGESDNWRVDQEVEIVETEGTNMSDTITYTGMESKSDSFYYEIDPCGGPFGRRELNNRDRMYIIHHGDTAPAFKSTVFPVTISWDG